MDEEQKDQVTDKEGDDGGNGGGAQGGGEGSQEEGQCGQERAWWRQSEGEEVEAVESGSDVSEAESDLRLVESTVRFRQELKKVICRTQRSLIKSTYWCYNIDLVDLLAPVELWTELVDLLDLEKLFPHLLLKCH